MRQQRHGEQSQRVAQLLVAEDTGEVPALHHLSEVLDAIEVLRLAAAVSVCEDEVAQLSFATHDIEDVDAFVSVAIENSAGTNDEFSIARAVEFRRPST